MLASMVLITIPIDSISWSKKAKCVSLNVWNEASSITAFTSVSNNTGSTIMFNGVPSPSPDETLI
jgi:hypothetical protein